jgi:hypothetical protein
MVEQSVLGVMVTLMGPGAPCGVNENVRTPFASYWTPVLAGKKVWVPQSAPLMVLAVKV